MQCMHLAVLWLRVVSFSGFEEHKRTTKIILHYIFLCSQEKQRNVFICVCGEYLYRGHKRVGINAVCRVELVLFGLGVAAAYK